MKDYAKIAERLYPGNTCPLDYQPIVDYIGKVVIQSDTGDYQGDTRVLYEDEGKGYGFLAFGWGSCSLCDALQACDTAAEVGELIEELENSVQWKPRSEMLEYFETHDWGGDWCQDPAFVEDVVEYLKRS